MEIDHQERRKGENSMERCKRRLDLEFPESKRTAQNLVDSARRFKKERRKNVAEWEEPRITSYIRLSLLLLLLLLVVVVVVSLLFCTNKLVFRSHIYNINLWIDYLYHKNINKHLKFTMADKDNKSGFPEPIF